MNIVQLTFILLCTYFTIAKAGISSALQAIHSYKSVGSLVLYYSFLKQIDCTIAYAFISSITTNTEILRFLLFVQCRKIDEIITIYEHILQYYS